MQATNRGDEHKHAVDRRPWVLGPKRKKMLAMVNILRDGIIAFMHNPAMRTWGQLHEVMYK